MARIYNEILKLQIRWDNSYLGRLITIYRSSTNTLPHSSRKYQITHSEQGTLCANKKNIYSASVVAHVLPPQPAGERTPSGERGALLGEQREARRPVTLDSRPLLELLVTCH